MHRLILGSAIGALFWLASASAAAQCAKDTDCKGDRICRDGFCVDPEPLPVPPPPPPPEAGYAPPQPGYAPVQPGYAPAQPGYAPVQPGYAPPQPAFTQVQPGYAPPQPSYPPPAPKKGGLLAKWRRGLEAELRLGLGLCADDGNAKCDDDYEYLPGIGFGATVGVRFLPYLLAGVDFGYQLNSVDQGDDAEFDSYVFRIMDVMHEVRGYLPFRYADIFIKVGVGYVSAKETIGIEGGDEATFRAYSPLGLKAGAGATFFFAPEGDAGDVGLGVDFDYVFTDPIYWEECEDGDCDSGDWDDGESDEGSGNGKLMNGMRLSLHFTWVFTIF